jgi:hypothetical protein
MEKTQKKYGLPAYSVHFPERTNNTFNTQQSYQPPVAYSFFDAGCGILYIECAAGKLYSRQSDRQIYRHACSGLQCVFQ